MAHTVSTVSRVARHQPPEVAREVRSRVNQEVGMIIETRFLAATNTRGERIKARLIGSSTTSITKGYDYSMSPVQAHASVAQALCAREGWKLCHETEGSTDYGFFFITT